MKTITLRLDDDDHKLFAVLATAEDLPLTMLIRRTMKQLAREKGLLESGYPQPVQAPRPTAVPVGKTPEERLKAEAAEFVRDNPTPPDDGLDYYIGRTTAGVLDWIPRQPDDGDSYPDA